jgi:hypothetical protein
MNDQLFDVPQNKTRLELVKEKHGITTTRRPLFETEGAEGWAAWLNTSQGWVHFGDTESDAVLELCRKQNIEVIL